MGSICIINFGWDQFGGRIVPPLHGAPLLLAKGCAAPGREGVDKVKKLAWMDERSGLDGLDGLGGKDRWDRVDGLDELDGVQGSGGLDGKTV